MDFDRLKPHLMRCKDGESRHDTTTLDWYLNQIGRDACPNSSQETALAWEIIRARKVLQSALAQFPVLACWLKGYLPEKGPSEQPPFALKASSEGLTGPLIDYGAQLKPLKEWIDLHCDSCLNKPAHENLVGARTTQQKLLAEIELPAERLFELVNDLNDVLYSDQSERVMIGVAEPDQAFAQLVEAQKKYQQAINALVKPNLRLVVHQALRYRRQRDAQLLDLIQEGNLGLLRATQTFDIRRGYRFSTYSTYWIHHYIDRAAIKWNSPVKRPLKAGAFLRRLQGFNSEDPRQNLERRKTLASQLGVSPRQFQAWLSLDQQPIPIESWYQEVNEGKLELASNDDALLHGVYQVQLKRAVEQGMKNLTERESQIITKRFGLDGNDPWTLQKLATRLALSRERVRQIESVALKKLRKQFALFGPACMT